MPPAPPSRTARRRRSAPLAPAAALALLATAACTSGAGAPEAEADGAWSPVTIEHAYGSTEITAEPERIVTLGWTSEAPCSNWASSRSASTRPPSPATTRAGCRGTPRRSRSSAGRSRP
ncbi:hypothetical protein ACFQXA_18295 [Nocardiopsis composta]